MATKLYNITAAQALELNEVEVVPGCFYNPVQDINGSWFISTQEVNQTTNPTLTPWLNSSLPLLDFIPIPTPVDPGTSPF